MKGLRTQGGWLRINKQNREEEITNEQVDTKYHLDTTLQDEKFKTLWWRILQKAVKEEPMVKPVGLQEALKVRVITKGPPYQQTVLRALWKKMHSTLREHPTFQLIGRPVDEKIILDVLGKNLADDEIYLSGDYEAATDNLKPWVSNTIAEQISYTLQLSQAEQRLFIQSLTGHVFEGGLKQATGQLMGSITSFPVLCIANAAMCRWAMEVAEGRKKLLRDCAMLINGDDVAIRSKRKIYRIWSQITSFIGLKESLGKTYATREFVDINSTSFTRLQEPFDLEYERNGQKILRQSYLRQTRYVNMGLVYGLKRSQGTTGLNDQMSPHENLGCRARELLRLAPPRLHNSIMGRFLQLHKKTLDIMNPLPWFMPEWMGGVGIPPGDWGRPSKLDRNLARMILKGQKKPISLAHQETNWKLWHLASQKAPEPFYSPQKTKESEKYSEFVGRYVIDLLFDLNYQTEDLMTEITESRATKAIKYNQKLWSPSTYTKRGVVKITNDPISDPELVFAPKYPSLYSY
jgi:hypothetical protein